MKNVLNWIRRLALKYILNRKAVKKMIGKLKDFLVGKKSYLAALGLLITSLIEFSNDGDMGKLIQRIFECLAIAGIRAAIA